eukprot:2850150-Rhodomonas_salina.1
MPLAAPMPRSSLAASLLLLLRQLRLFSLPLAVQLYPEIHAKNTRNFSALCTLVQKREEKRQPCKKKRHKRSIGSHIRGTTHFWYKASIRACVPGTREPYTSYIATVRYNHRVWSGVHAVLCGTDAAYAA